MGIGKATGGNMAAIVRKYGGRDVGGCDSGEGCVGRGCGDVERGKEEGDGDSARCGSCHCNSQSTEQHNPTEIVHKTRTGIIEF